MRYQNRETFNNWADFDTTSSILASPNVILMLKFSNNYNNYFNLFFTLLDLIFCLINTDGPLNLLGWTHNFNSSQELPSPICYTSFF